MCLFIYPIGWDLDPRGLETSGQRFCNNEIEEKHFLCLVSLVFRLNRLVPRGLFPLWFHSL